MLVGRSYKGSMEMLTWTIVIRGLGNIRQGRTAFPIQKHRGLPRLHVKAKGERFH